MSHDQIRSKSLTAEESSGSNEPIFVRPMTTGEQWFETALSPLVIRRLLGLGGGLTVIGIIVWLASLGVFDNAYLLAGAMGLGNLSLFSLGWLMAARTGRASRSERFRTSGLAISMLASVLAPLNLWFYHSEGILTLENHLWVGGLVCCAFYFATIYLVRSPLFVYTIQLGIALTGGLFMAELGYANHITWACLALLSLAATSIHFERVFPIEGEFRRDTYGRAMLRCGHTQLGIALIVLLISQAASVFANDAGLWLGIEWFAAPLVTQAWLASLIWLAAGYLYVYTYRCVDDDRRWLLLGLVCFLFAPATVFGGYVPNDAYIVLVAWTGAALSLGRRFIETREVGADLAFGHRVSDRWIDRAVALTALVSAAGAVWLWLVDIEAIPAFFLTVLGTDVVFLSSLCLVVPAYLLAIHGSSARSKFVAYSIGVSLGVLLLIVSSTAISFFIATSIEIHQALAMLGLVLTSVYVAKQPLSHESKETESSIKVWVHGGLSFVAIWFGATTGLVTVGNMALGSSWDLMTLAPVVATSVYFVVSFWLTGRSRDRVIGAAGLLYSLFGLLLYLELGETTVIATILAIGWITVLIGRIRRLDDYVNGVELLGHMTLGFTALGVLLRGASQVVANGLQSGDLIPVGLAIVSQLAAIPLTPKSGRASYWGGTLLHGVLVMVMAHELLGLSPLNELKIASIAVGSLLTIVGIHARVKEFSDQSEPGVAFPLWGGSLLIVMPLMMFAIGCRLTTGMSLGDELGLMAASIVLITLGLLLQLRSTVVLGGLGMAVELAILAISLFYRANLTIGVTMAILGAAIFVVAILLNIFREQIGGFIGVMGKNATEGK